MDYCPRFNQLAGAWVDLGNAYLLLSHVDLPPVPGQLVVFPAWLPHKAMPCAGTLDRVIISFNIGVGDRNGRNLLQPFGP